MYVLPALMNINTEFRIYGFLILLSVNNAFLKQR
jgi:hypothetical protein